MTGEEKKPLPSLEMSAKYASWSLKEMAQTLAVQEKMLDQKMSELVGQLREINKHLSTNEKSPF